MDSFVEAFVIAGQNWVQIVLTIIGCAVALLLAEYLGLTRPWPFSVILGGILSLMILESYPHVWIVGKWIGAFTWAIMACMTHCVPYVIQSGKVTRKPASIWEHFEEVRFESDSHIHRGGHHG